MQYVKSKSFKQELTDATDKPLVCDRGNKVGVGKGASVLLWLHYVVRILVKDNGYISEMTEGGLQEKKKQECFLLGGEEIILLIGFYYLQATKCVLFEQSIFQPLTLLS